MFDAENVNAILSANIQFTNTFADPPGRNFYFKNGVLLVDLYVVENMVGSVSDRCPFCHLFFRVDYLVGTVAKQKLCLHIPSQMVLITLMYLGRVGGLTLIYATFSSKKVGNAKLPQEKITIG